MQTFRNWTRSYKLSSTDLLQSLRIEYQQGHLICLPLTPHNNCQYNTVVFALRKKLIRNEIEKKPHLCVRMRYENRFARITIVLEPRQSCFLHNIDLNYSSWMFGIDIGADGVKESISSS